MRLVCAFVIAGILLASAAFAVTTYTETIYAGTTSGATGFNWIALRGAPIPPAGSTNAPGHPGDIWPGVEYVDGYLSKLNPVTGGTDDFVAGSFEFNVLLG